MPRHDDKRQQRQLKRDIKRAGNKRRRRQLKEDLARNPADAAHSEVDFGRYSSEGLNGMDDDAKSKGEDQAQ